MNIIPWKQRTTWNPFREMETLQEEMNKLFNFSLGRWNGETPEGSDGVSLIPVMDIADSKNQVKITTEIPGIDKKDLNVSVDGNNLIIRAEKKREEKSEEEGIVRVERSFGTFYRTVTLPSTVDTSKIEASYKNGVLTLTLPKREEAKPKQIAIDVKEN